MAATNPPEERSLVIDWPEGALIEDPDVRYVHESNGVSVTWVEVGRIGHPADGHALFARIEVVFRPPGWDDEA